MRLLPFACLSITLVVSRSAAATPAACSTMTVTADARTRDRYPDVESAIRIAFEERSDIDACARVDVRSERANLRVDVRLPDGRAASRLVARPEDLVPTLEALLLLPAAAREEASVPPAASDAEAPPDTATASDPVILSVAPAAEAPTHAPARPTSTSTSTHLGFELSAVAGARVGDGQVGGGAGAVSSLDIAGWLVGFSGRYDQYAAGGSIVVPALELALLVGRRIRSGNIAVDVVGGPAVVTLGLQTTEDVVYTPTGRRSLRHESNGTLPRAAFATRVHFGLRRTLRSFVSFEAELGPRRDDELVMPQGPSLPLWTVGIALGATVGTR